MRGWCRRVLRVSEGFVFASVIACLLTACGRPEFPQPAAPLSVLHRGLGGEPGSLDPAHAVDTYSFTVLDDLYEGLTSLGPDGAVVPGVAETWSVSPDGLVYTFKLRATAKWSNGNKVRAQDFVTAWRQVVDPKQGSPQADVLRVIAGTRDIRAGRATPESLQVVAPSDDELIVHLESPAVYFPEVLSHSAAFPVYADGAPATHSAVNWISNGPFVLASWTPGGSLKLNKNRNYWDQNHVALDAVEYVPALDEATEWTRYRAGALDLTESVPANAIESIRAERPSELHVSPLLATAYYAFNLHKTPFKESRDLREALAMAIDRQVILKTILPFGQRAAYGFVAEGIANYTPQSWDWKGTSDEARITQAKALYARAGYSAAHPLHLSLLYNANSNIRQLAIATAEMWSRTLGVETTLTDEEYRVFLESRHDPKRYDIVRLGWSADYNDAQSFLDTLRSGAANNDGGYSSPKYDDLLSRAEQTANPVARRALLEEAEWVMLADYPIAPIFFLSIKRMVKPYVKGVAGNPENRLYSKYLSIVPH